MPTKSNTQFDVITPEGGGKKPYAQLTVGEIRVNGSAAWGTPGVSVNGPKGRNIIPVDDIPGVVEALVAMHAEWATVSKLTDIAPAKPAPKPKASPKPKAKGNVLTNEYLVGEPVGSEWELPGVGDVVVTDSATGAYEVAQ